MEPMPRMNLNTAKSAASKATATLKSAGGVVAKTAERSTLLTVTLPRAYGALGKAIFRDPGRRQDFPELFQSIDSLLADRKRIQEEATARSAGATYAERARRVVGDAAALAKTKAIDVRAFNAFVRLGQEGFRQKGNAAGPAEFVETISKAVARQDTLDREIAAISGGQSTSWFTRKRLLWAGGLLFGLMMIGRFAGRGDDSRGVENASESESVSTQSLESDTTLAALAAGAMQECVIGMSPEKVQATLRAVAGNQSGQWGNFRGVKPSRVKETVINSIPLLTHWYGKSMNVKYTFYDNLYSGDWELTMVHIDNKRMPLQPRQGCDAWIFRLMHNETYGEAIVQVPITPKATVSTGEIAERMLRSKLGGEVKVFKAGILAVVP